jgi:16S rRNA (guanine527-N7)-methyltransferase
MIKQHLKKALTKINLELSEDQLSRFEAYYDLLIRWNEKINLTAITDPDEVVKKHFIDSLSLIRVLSLNEVESVIDVGTGAGFPGIPLKIAFPHLKITLLDSLNKRIQYLGEVNDNLALSDVILIHGRAENIARDPEHRQRYDLCVSRAVANLSVLSELCTPFVKTGGIFTPYKSEKAEEEISGAANALDILGCEIKRVEKFDLFGQMRCIPVIEKVRDTDEKYPRREGIPGKRPL